MLELSAIKRIKLEVKSQEINETKGYKDLQHDLLFSHTTSVLRSRDASTESGKKAFSKPRMPSPKRYSNFEPHTFTFSHLADAFIQSDLQL